METRGGFIQIQLILHYFNTWKCLEWVWAADDELHKILLWYRLNFVRFLNNTITSLKTWSVKTKLWGGVEFENKLKQLPIHAWWACTSVGFYGSTICFDNKYTLILTEVSSGSSRQADDNQIKPTQWWTHEEQGHVGTEHLAPKLHWFASLPSRYATNCKHPSLKSLGTGDTVDHFGYPDCFQINGLQLFYTQ